jgi:hypothetical protein
MKAYILLSFGVGKIPDGVQFCKQIPGVIEVKALWGVFDAVAKVDAVSLETVVHKMREFGGLLSTFCLPIRDD